MEKHTKSTLRPSPKALLNPLADPTFKILFTDSSPEAHEALTCFLTDILGKPVTDVVLQPNELSGEDIHDKQSEFDINCKLDGKVVNIEMQGKNFQSDYGQRAEYHVAHLLNHYTPKGMDWINIPQVFQISVLNFVFDEKEEDCISVYTMKNDHQRPVSETMNIIFLELPKVEQLPDDVTRLTPAQMWGKFFISSATSEKQDFVKALCKVNRGIKMAVTVLENVSQDELNWYHESRYWMHVSDVKTSINASRRKGLAEGRAEGREQGLAEGRAEGRAEGAAAANLENARKMKDMNIDYDTILKITGITKEMLD